MEAFATESNVFAAFKAFSALVFAFVAELNALSAIIFCIFTNCSDLEIFAILRDKLAIGIASSAFLFALVASSLLFISIALFAAIIAIFASLSVFSFAVLVEAFALESNVFAAFKAFCAFIFALFAKLNACSAFTFFVFADCNLDSQNT